MTAKNKTKLNWLKSKRNKKKQNKTICGHRMRDKTADFKTRQNGRFSRKNSRFSEGVLF